MPSDVHMIDCHCRACTGPRDTAQRWTVHRQRRRSRVAYALAGLIAATALALILL